MSKGLDISSISLDACGRAILGDAELAALASLCEVSLAGAGPSTNGGCTNAASCQGSTNTQCTNTATCQGANNFHCPRGGGGEEN